MQNWLNFGKNALLEKLPFGKIARYKPFGKIARFNAILGKIQNRVETLRQNAQFCKIYIKLLDLNNNQMHIIL